MGKRANFTADRIASARCDTGKQQTIYWDGKTPGLGLRVTANGAKAYIFETRLHGRTIRRTIGSPDTWPLETQWRTDPQTKARVEFRRGAREEAQRLKALTDQGLDPRELEADRLEAEKARKAAAAAERAAAEAEATRQSITMGEAWKAYIKARKHKWGARYLNDHKYVIAGKNTPAPLAALVHLRLADLTADHLAAWLKEESEKRPTSANIAFRKLRAFLAWCDGYKAYAGLVPAGAYAAKEVMDELPKQKAKGDALQREQLPLWFGAVAKLQPVVSTYLRVLLLTGARREELAGLKWADVDFQWKSLTIRDKVEGQRIIPLTPFVSNLLAQLPRRGEWVFSSPTAKSGRIQGPHVAHQKALTTAGLPHVSLHGLRRSFKSLAEWVEMPVGVVAQIMGHKPSATAEKHYTVRPLDLLRMWHTRYEAWILEQAGIEQPAQDAATGLRVVSIKPAA